MRYVLCTANKDAKTIDDLKEFAVLPREWVDGVEVELGSKYPQVIPSAILRNQEGKILVYSRKGSEGRLHGFKSILIGGHVDLTDIAKSVIVSLDKDILNSVCEGLQRELLEEVNLMSYIQKEDFKFTIYHPVDEVSSVHLGLVAVIDAETVTFGDELGNPQWMNIEDINVEELEPWSAYALEKIKE